VTTRGGRDELLALLPVPRWLIGLMDQTLSVLRLQQRDGSSFESCGTCTRSLTNVRCARRIRGTTTCLNAGSAEDLVVRLAEPKAAL
jgi:hypothetical protein